PGRAGFGIPASRLRDEHRTRPGAGRGRPGGRRVAGSRDARAPRLPCPAMILPARLLVPLSVVLSLATAAHAENPVVRVATPMGDFDIELCNELSTRCLGVAPNTVANFLSYVDSDSYNNSFVHRSVVNFVIQGGSFTANHVDFPIGNVPN